MSLQNERGEPTRRKWLSRFSRERLDLSASVEETLLDERNILQQDLLDSVDSGVEGASLQTSLHTKVISPRLTMQSNPMPVVRALPASQTSQADGEQKVEKAQKTGIFARFGRRSTSSMAARSSDTPPGIASSAPSLPQLPATTTSHPAASSTRQQSRADAVSEESQMLPATSKVNGRPTKIRLETAPGPAIELQKKEAVGRPEQGNVAQTLLPNSRREGNAWAATSDMQSLDMSVSIPTTPSPGFPILDFYRLDVRDSSMRLPAISATEERLQVSKNTRETLSGSGVFEAGQNDVTLENTHITATAIVLVTLTSNPGPAVVQYVSLQPAVGFTIHLSAPAAMKTSFNYIILLGEMF
jgi:hypothetical protein